MRGFFCLHTCVMKVVSTWPPFLFLHSGSSDVNNSACDCAVLLCRCPVHVFLFSILLIVHHLIVTGLILTFSQHSFASCCLALLALCCPSVMSSSLLTVVWQAGRAVRLPVWYSWCSCAPQFQFSASVNWINQSSFDFWLFPLVV